MTLRIWPSSRLVVSNWQLEVTPAKLNSESNTSRPIMLLPVALLPLPVFPTSTRVFSRQLTDSDVLIFCRENGSNV